MAISWSCRAAGATISTQDFRPAMQGWLQFYVSAIGFKLFGDGTWAARFPFALIGAVGLFFFYRIYIRLNQGRAALYVAVATVASLPYLHYARQSRYYALALVVSLALIDIWLEVVRRRDGKGIAPFVKLGFCGVLLFLTNYLTFILLWSSLVVGLLVWLRKDLVVGLAATSAAVAAVVTPLLVSVHGSFIERAEIGKLAYLADYWMWFLDTLERANLLLPIVPLLVLGGYLAWRRKESVAEEGDIVAWFWLTILTTAVVVVLLNKSNGFLRYTLHLIPIAHSPDHGSRRLGFPHLGPHPSSAVCSGVARLSRRVARAQPFTVYPEAAADAR